MPSTNGRKGPKRAVLYARVSTDEQGKSGYSIPDQLRENRSYAAREGSEIVDDGHSGPLRTDLACGASWNWQKPAP